MYKLVESVMKYPDWLDQELWSDYLEYRKEIKAPLTATGEKRALRKLQKLLEDGGDQTMIIESTIDSGKWKGLFQKKQDGLPHWKDMDKLVAHGTKMGLPPRIGEEAYEYWQRLKNAS